MKCIQFHDGQVVRVSVKVAEQLVKSLSPEIRYVSKEVWKQQGRQYQLKSV